MAGSTRPDTRYKFTPEAFVDAIADFIVSDDQVRNIVNMASRIFLMVMNPVIKCD